MLASLPRLEKGSIVDIIAPAAACSRADLKKSVQFVENMGFVPRVSPKIFGGRTILANSDEERFKQLKKALLAPDSDFIWCVRGGYGSFRLFPELARMKKPKKYKLLLGYSDITSLHSFLNSVWHWPSLHGPNLERFSQKIDHSSEIREVSNILSGKFENALHVLTPMNAVAKKRRAIRGSIVGGNVATLQASLGTPWPLKTKGHILFLEDIGERPHRMDRMLMQMVQAGFFTGVKAIVFGGMNLPIVADRRVLWNDVLARFANEQKIPVLKGLKAGHTKVQRVIPFLTKVELITGRSAKLALSLKPS